jgi:hypothetical protein
MKAGGYVDDLGTRAGVQAESIGNGEIARLHGTPPAIGANEEPRRTATGELYWSADSSDGSANSFPIVFTIATVGTSGHQALDG